MDTSIIGVALPDMRADLGFTPGSLSWVFNAYVVAFGGLLLLGGRLSDLFRARRVFSTGWLILLGHGGVDVFGDECDVADSRGVRRRMPVVACVDVAADRGRVAAT